MPEEQRRGRGRPGIGPKVQTHIPLGQAMWIQREARSRKVEKSVVLREIVGGWFEDRSIVLAEDSL